MVCKVTCSILIPHVNIVVSFISSYLISRFLMSKIKLFNIRSLVFVSFPEGFVESFLLGVMVDLPTLLFDLFNLCFFFFFFDDDAFLFCF